METDLKLARLQYQFWQMEQQQKQADNEAGETKAELPASLEVKKRELYEEYIEPIANGRLKIRNEFFYFEKYSFWADQMILPMVKNRFTNITPPEFAEKYQERILAYEPGIVLSLKLREEIPLLSQTFFKKSLELKLKSEQLPVEWVKLGKTEQLHYALYQTFVENNKIQVFYFVNRQGGKTMEGQYMVSETFATPWLDIIEASLHLAEFTFKEEK